MTTSPAVPVPVPVPVLGINHIGIRVLDPDRSEGFFVRLGFTVTARFPQHKVVILHHPAGLELNLIANADPAHDGENALMDDDLPKRAGYTHIALSVPSVDEAMRALAAHAIPIAEGPVPLGGAWSLFVRDPDRNVVELRGPRGP